MIWIDKPSLPPAVLTGRGAERTAADCQRFDDEPESYQSGERKFAFRNDLYGDPSVKDTLIAAQHGKCCFCERLTMHDGDVEHYRPKSSTRQQKKDPYERPGYYWLAYDWDNLFLSCSPCNSREKGALFPLEDPSVRARSHHDSLEQEEPLFIKPDADDPEEHIGFRADVPFPRTERGRVTIEALSLDRDVLCEARLRRLHVLHMLRNIVAIASRAEGNVDLQDAARDAEQALSMARSDEGEYASAVRCAEADGYAFVIPPSPG